MEYLTKDDLNLVLGRSIKPKTRLIFIILILIIIFASLITFLILTGYIKFGNPTDKLQTNAV